MDQGGLYVCLTVMVAAVLATMIAVIVVAVRSRERWLTRGDEIPIGRGEYRSATSTADPRLRRRRFFVIAIAVTNVPIAAFWLFLLVPAGLIAGLIGLEPTNSQSWYLLSLGVAALDGIPMSILLAVAAFTIVRRNKRTMLVNVVSAVWSITHHALIMAAGLVFWVQQDSPYAGGDIGLFAAVVAGIGLLHAVGTLIAAILARPETAPPIEAQDGAAPDEIAA